MTRLLAIELSTLLTVAAASRGGIRALEVQEVEGQGPDSLLRTIHCESWQAGIEERPWPAGAHTAYAVAGPHDSSYQLALHVRLQHRSHTIR